MFIPGSHNDIILFVYNSFTSNHEQYSSYGLLSTESQFFSNCCHRKIINNSEAKLYNLVFFQLILLHYVKI